MLLQVSELEQEKRHVIEQLEAEREKVELVEQECAGLRDGRETLDKKLDQMQRRLHRVRIQSIETTSYCDICKEFGKIPVYIASLITRCVLHLEPRVCFCVNSKSTLAFKI